uniref:Peptidase M12B domain-containing protein n=1 Tax=Macrostomum lignano TaxID=282301 RepID=A0A1I8JI40_9PLAT
MLQEITYVYESYVLNILAIFLAVSAAAQASVSVTQSSGDGPHPSSMEIELQLPDTDKKVRIPLTKTAPLDGAVVTVTDGGVSRTFSGRQAQHGDQAHYRNVDSKSVISVRHENGTKRISGHVMHKGTSYVIQPIGDSGHRVSKTKKTADGTQPEQLLSRKKRRVNREATEYEVEIHILIDHTVWKAFKTIFGTDDKALTELHFYYSHIVIGMDTVFRNIGSPSISVRCIGLTVAKTEADAKWMPPDSSADASDGGATLGRIRAYSKGDRADHVMGFTRRDISLGKNSAVTGVAFENSACQETKVSVVEDSGLHSWMTAAHELAHNLGASHDNNEPGCEMDLKFIMSPAATSYDLSNIANSYRFSPCTVRQIRTYLDSGKAACLQSRQGTPISQLTSSVREGARMSLDQVCRLNYPSSPGNIFLTEDVKANPALLCAKMHCLLKADHAHGTTSTGFRAPVGSPCGNKKSCNWDGQCVADEAAPAADESCFFGDIWGDQCGGWKTYIEYLRNTDQKSQRRSYCGQTQTNCCASLKNLCRFD